MAQTEDKLNALFLKKWSISTYEIAGQKFQATDFGSDDYTLFYPDYKVKSLDRGIVTLSNWRYDGEKNYLTLFSDHVEETTEMRIITLTENEFVWETTNPEGFTMKIYMVYTADK